MAHSIQKHASLSPLEERLNDVIPGYRDHLERQGLGPSAVRRLVAVARHLVVWMRMNGIETGALDIRRIAEFASHDCACPGRLHCHASARTRPQAERFLAYLMDTGRAEMPVQVVEGGRLVDAFVGSLSDQGYSDSVMRDHRQVCRHLVVWLFLSRLELARIDEDAIQRFLGHGCACSCPHFRRIGRIDGSRRHRAKVRKFADFLVGEGVIERWREAGPAPRSELVDGFLGWMRRHRGARETTVHEYGRLLHRKLLPGLAGDPAAWNAASIRNAFAVWSQSNTSRELARMTSVLRVYLRHLGAIGICRPELAGAVPAVRRQKAADLPRHASESEIEALVDSCDPATPIGRRDRAVMLLLARLALRAGDVRALRLDDIDWNRARIRFSGKSRRSEALPLPQDAGDALRSYILDGRPRVRSDFVFLRFRAPHVPLHRRGITTIVRCAKQRAGVGREGLPAAHLFRHSKATALLRSGASLETVSTILRHRSVEATTLYARVDAPMLLEVAQPWPGDES